MLSRDPMVWNLGRASQRSKDLNFGRASQRFDGLKFGRASQRFDGLQGIIHTNVCGPFTLILHASMNAEGG